MFGNGSEAVGKLNGRCSEMDQKLFENRLEAVSKLNGRCSKIG
jgi:hypothetical protein